MAKPSQQKPIEGAQFVRYFGPLLDALRKLGGSGTPDEVVEQIAEDLKLSDEVQNELLSSGEPRYRNQVAWARFYLVREGLLDSSRRGVWSLTERERVTTLNAQQAREVFLKWVRIFQEQRRAKAGKSEPPEEIVAEATGTTPHDYRSAITDVLLKLPPAGFERLRQRVLREAGFTQVVVTGRSGDGGIDGYGTLSVNALVSFKYCSNASASASPFRLRTYAISAAAWLAVPTRASSLPRAPSRLRRAVKLHVMECRPSNSSTARNSSTCANNSNSV